MSIVLILVFVFSAVLMLLATIMISLQPQKNIKSERINDFYKDVAAAVTTPIKVNVESKSSTARIKKITKYVRRFYEKDEKKLAKIRESLYYAGFYREENLRNFLTLRIAGAVFFFALSFFAAVMVKPIGNAFFVGLLFGFVGYSIPNSRLQAKIRKRQEKIGNSLPDALDLLVISVEAGRGLIAAILKVGQEMQIRCNAISEELLMVNQEIRAGLSREEALRNLGRRNKNENLRILVSSIIMADKLGSSVADTLRSQSDSLRARVRQKVEEQAAKAGVKLLFPLVLFILPALFLVILGPGFITIMKAFSEIN